MRVNGGTTRTNDVLPPWLQAELTAILAAQPPPPGGDPEAQQAAWAGWQAGLREPFTLPDVLPPLRLLLGVAKRAGHQTPAFVLWLVAHGVRPRYTPRGGSWRNLAASIQRIRKRRALDGAHPATPQAISAQREAPARGWNRAPTPFVWGGNRAARRERARQRRHARGGSGARTLRPVRRRPRLTQHWRRGCQPTH